MGAIQPARFLTDTGHIRPGVSRVVQVKNPAVATDWSVAVPAGVQWGIRTATATLTTGAATTSYTVRLRLTVDGVIVAQFACNGAPSSSTDNVYTWSNVAQQYDAESVHQTLNVGMPNLVLPQGCVIGTSTLTLDATGQWSAIALWVEEYYFTNPQLATIETLHQAAERVYIQELEQSLAQTGGGN